MASAHSADDTISVPALGRTAALGCAVPTALREPHPFNLTLTAAAG